MSTEFKAYGTTITVNRPDLVPLMQEVIEKGIARNEAFHKALVERGVKAYRCNDGWVDRENFKVTFIGPEREKGYYWGSKALLEGDLIFIGNSHSGGRFARITGPAKSYGPYSWSYYFEPLDWTLEGVNGLSNLCPLRKETQ